MRQWLWPGFFFFVLSFLQAENLIQLASTPALNPDGSKLAFYWRNQIWEVNTSGGIAKQLTFHPNGSHNPIYTKDGETLYFTSRRSDGQQIFRMPVTGGEAEKLTFHTDGYSLNSLMPDDQGAIATVWRNYRGLEGKRLVKVSFDGETADQLLFDAYADEGVVSPDGTSVLFVREGTGISPYRKGYLGSTVCQIWQYQFSTQKFTPLLKERYGNRNPIWRPDGKAFYYCSEEDGSYNLWEYELATQKRRQLTFLKDSPVLIPALSADGKTLVFRHLFDFYRINPTQVDTPVKIEIKHHLDFTAQNSVRRKFDKVWNEENFGHQQFTEDGMETAFCVGGGLYVMDTVLRKPVAVDQGSGFQVTELIFAENDQTIYYLKDSGDAVNIWKARPADTTKYWWENTRFVCQPVTNDTENRSQLSISPDGQKLAFFKKRATLCTTDLNGQNEQIVVSAPYKSYYAWSPDSQYMLATLQASSHNSNVWIIKLDESEAPYNLSRTPGWCSHATWSPDGRIITFISYSTDERYYLNWLYLDPKEDEQTREDRKQREALETMERARGKRQIDPIPTPQEPQTPQNLAETATTEENKAEPMAGKTPDAVAETTKFPSVVLDGLYERLNQKTFNWSGMWGFFWHPNNKELTFSGSVNGKNGTHTLMFPELDTPKFITDRTGWYGRWHNNQIFWMLDGYPAHFDRQFTFEVFQTINVKERQAFAYRKIWRLMRDNFCDPDLKNLDWRKILDKYEAQAANAVDQAIFDRLVGMLLGELNASHLGWSRTNHDSNDLTPQWSLTTYSLGILEDQQFKGYGVKIGRITKDSPAELKRSRLNLGDIITDVDGQPIKNRRELDQALTMPQLREVTLTVLNSHDQSREVKITPITFRAERELVKEETIHERRQIVSNLSNQRLGYLNIERMNNPSLRRFENEIYSQGFGKDGLVIDVRSNPGGFISDYLLAILCHPKHAVTIPREGERSYPDGYLPNVVWHKPIVVLCNQFSCSNAEIFSHAIKTLKRGKLVGVETQACVISTPRQQVLDMGKLATPDRAWWPLGTLVDMEAEGAIPDYEIWPTPGDMPAGKDTQLEKAIEVLLEEVNNQPEEPKLIRFGHDQAI